MYHKMEDSFHCTLHLFMETRIILLEWERKLETVKKKKKNLREKDCCSGKTVRLTQFQF